ncbi:Protein ALP1-like [Linum perenne]
MARRPRISTLRRRKIIALICFFLQLVTHYIWIVTKVCEVIVARFLQPRISNTPLDTFTERHYDRMRFIRKASSKSDASSLRLIRMNRLMFSKLCELLVVKGGLVRSNTVDINEMVIMFLYTIAHNEKNRQLSEYLCRSGETISRNIHKVLRAMLKLNHILLKKPEPIPDNSNDVKWRHFKNCLGALDGSHINVRVPLDMQTRYRDRKGNTSINILGVCTPKLEFIYCLSGWEGSAHDGRVLRDALARPNGLKVPEGSYYLCDAGYSNCPGFLTPYRGQRYHLKEWGANRPNTAEEYYNMKHASARNTIERAFGVLKMRWAILRDTTWFSTRVVTQIINACVLLHNFIKREQGVDIFERNYRDSEPDFHETADVELISTVQPSTEWTKFRNNLAVEMWENRSRG